MALFPMRRNRMFQAASIPLLLALATACGSDFTSPVGIAQAAEGIRIAAPTMRIVEPKGQQVAIFAGGCFWGVEAVFEGLKGAARVESGYAGGARATADYDSVSTGITGHAEAVRIYYDPAVVSYNDLLHIFFSVTHDPTQLNRQGPDHGRQYRTAIFPTNAPQRVAARAYITQLDKAAYWKKRIVTRIEPLSFYPAESYHQNFMAKNPSHPYIVQWDKRKIANLRRLFPNRLR
jgi:peptide-methionine (S)-S-oxide reductase